MSKSRYSKTAHKHGITAMAAALTFFALRSGKEPTQEERNDARTIGAHAMLGLTKLTPSAQLHPDNVSHACVEMTRLALMTGLMQLGVKEAHK